MKKVLPLIVVIGLLLVGCGPKAPPTPDAAMVQQTAVAMAFTMSAQTQAAQPSATPIPPTATATLPPPASPTPFQLPTFPSQATATQAVTGGACNSLMDPAAGGPKVYVVIDNRTKGTLVFSLYLNETPFACGYVRGVSNIGPNQNVGVTIPEGCYFPSVYINGLKKQLSFAGPLRCIHGNDKITIKVSESGISWVFP